jgi:hypothetical protein
MAVDLRKTYSNGSLEMLYNYENETLKQATNVLYQFPRDSQSVVQVKGQPYKPVRLHLTPVLHSGNHDSEMIVEHQGKDGKLFICFMLRKGTNPSLSFPLKDFSLDGFVSHCTTNQYYKTASKGHVLLCTSVIDVGDDFPSIYGTAKKKYKEIFEPNVFNVLNSIMTLVDNKNKVIDIETENVLLKKGKKRDIVEGFSENTEPDTFMECSLLEDVDGGVDFEEYAVSPLDYDRHKRGHEILSTVLGVVVVLVGSIFIVPILTIDILGWLMVQYEYYYKIILIFLQVVFFVLAWVFIGIGESKNKGGILTAGIYFIFIWLGAGIGSRMKIYGNTNDFEVNEGRYEIPNPRNYLSPEKHMQLNEMVAMFFHPMNAAGFR